MPGDGHFGSKVSLVIGLSMDSKLSKPDVALAVPQQANTQDHKANHDHQNVQNGPHLIQATKVLRLQRKPHIPFL